MVSRGLVLMPDLEFICNMLRKRLYFVVAALFVVMASSGQCRFCYSYEDFVEDRWEPLDTVFLVQHSKNHQVWWGGNDFTLSTGDSKTDKILKKEAFAVMQADTMYVNCRSLRFEKTRFGNGYAKAMRIGNRSILFVNKLIGKDAMASQQMSALMFGAIGAAISAKKYVKQQVCYVISYGADEKGHISIRLIDDALMEQMVEGHDELRDDYYSETDEKERRMATHIVPILEKAGLFKISK